MTAVAAGLHDVIPLPDAALSALADLVELRARKLFPEKFADRAAPETPAPAASDDEA